SLPPPESSSRSTVRPAAVHLSWSVCFGSIPGFWRKETSPPRYVPRTPDPWSLFTSSALYGSKKSLLFTSLESIVAPEHANETNVTELCGSARSRRSADCAAAAFAERLQRRSSQTAPC